MHLVLDLPPEEAAQFEAWAAQLESRDAPATASFVREAARVYVARGLLAG